LGRYTQVRGRLGALDHHCFASFARVVILRCTYFGGASYTCFTSGHGIAETVSGVEAAIHCGDELWFGVGMHKQRLS